MRLRQALIEQSPSLALQRAAADEIAALDAMILKQREMLEQAVRPASVPDLYERLAAAHDASLDDDHRACRVILTEVMSLLAAAPQAPQPEAHAKLQKPNYRAECWPESPHNKQAEQGGK